MSVSKCARERTAGLNARPPAADPRRPTSAVRQVHDLTIAAEYEGLLHGHNLDSLDALFAVSDGQSLGKPGLAPWRERIRLTLNDGEIERTLYLKRFWDPPRAARREVRRSGTGASSVAGLEWSWIRRLAADGIACVKPVAFGESLAGSRERRSAILTEAAPGRSLEYWARPWAQGDRSAARKLIPPLAALVARLHDRGYVHRDLYLSHIFYDPAQPPEQSLRLIDLQRVLRPRWRRRRWIIKDLASLNFSTPIGLASTTDRVRWLKHYLGAPKLDSSLRSFLRRVVRKTRRIARHDERRRARFRTGNGS